VFSQFSRERPNFATEPSGVCRADSRIRLHPPPRPKGRPWNPRALENSLTAIEHLKPSPPSAFAFCLKTFRTRSPPPEHLLEIVRVGHFDRVGVTLDLGHAHLAAPENNKGIDEAFELLRPRIAELHIHDNLVQKDDHLWPGTAGIDWQNVAKQIATLPASTSAILEISHELDETTESVTAKATRAFDLLKRATEHVA